MPRLVAALDADVLVPILSCDFLLTAFDLGLYEPIVAAHTLVEVERSLLVDFPNLNPIPIRRRVRHLQDALEDHLIDSDPLGDLPEVINPKDRHVVAAALTGEASVVVSNDRKLRTEIATANLGLDAMSGDDFATDLWQRMPDDVDEVISVLVAKRSKRPVTPEELVEALRRAFPTMAAAWTTRHRA